LVVVVATSIITAKLGGNAMAWHLWSGYAALTLLLFRLLWGVAGDRYARFTSFVRGPRAVLAYLRGGAGGLPGHNPLGGWSVLALLAVMLTQGLTGLFASDDIATEGPLAARASGSVISWATRIHHWNEKLIYALIALHIAAILFYAIARRNNLVRPMLLGDRSPLGAPAAQDDATIRVRALIFLTLAAGLVAYFVNL
jgi:cytochrome b